MNQAESALQYQKKAAKAAKKETRKNLTMSLIGILLILVALGALGYFVFYPYVILPELDATDLNTPEMVQIYCDSRGESIFTVTGCTPDGKVYATYECMKDGAYGRVKLEGKITQKKNKGDLTVTWHNQTVDVDAPGLPSLTETAFTDKWETLRFGDVTLSPAVNYCTVLKTPEDLNKLKNAHGLFLLLEDIDLKGTPFTPIPGFSGTLLGNGHTIQNMEITTTGSQIGFFADLPGRVVGLDFENAAVTVTGKCENVGILCGTLSGFAANIYVSGAVTAEEGRNIGGICGCVQTENADKRTLAKLNNSADVLGLENVGGIAGSVRNQNGRISLSGCKNTGEIDGNTLTGGLCGEILCQTDGLTQTNCTTRRGNKYGNTEIDN
jgi:hypothetical protein